jgi:hypothetical protein
LASRRTALRCIRPSSTLTGNFAGRRDSNTMFLHSRCRRNSRRSPS